MSSLGATLSRRSLRWLGIGIPVLGVLIVVTLWLVLVLVSAASEERAVNEALVKAQSLTRAFEEYSQRNLQHVDQITQFIAYSYETQRQGLDLPSLVHQGTLDQPDFVAVYVADSQGDVIANTFATNTPLNVADREVFKVHQGNRHLGLFVGQPVQGKLTQAWMIHMSRRLTAADGSFAGVVAVIVNPAYFTNFYDEAQFGKLGMLGVIGQDSILRARRSGRQLWYGEPAGRPNLAEQVAKMPSGTDIATSSVDKVTRFMAYKMLDGYPLVVYTGLAREEAMAAHQADKARLQFIFLLAAAGLLAAFLGLHALVARLRNSQARVEIAQAQLNAASSAQLDAFLILRALRDPAGRIVDFACDYCNDRAAHMLGRTQQDVLSQTRQALLGDQGDPEFFDRYCRVVESRSTEIAEKSVAQPSGESLWLHHQLVAVGDGLSITVRDMTDERQKGIELLQAQQASQASAQRLRAIADNLPALVAYVDRDERYTFANSYFQTLLGLDPASILGKDMREVRGEEAYTRAIPHVQAALRGERSQYGGKAIVGQVPFYFESNFIPDIGRDGEVLGFYAMTFDVTVVKEAELRLSELARVDSLTGLANRHQFNESLQTALARAQRSGNAVALMFLDVDHFKAINDTYGHAAGDQVLKEFASRLQQSVRISDTVARLAGDEFVVILDNLHTGDEAEAVARKILAQIGLPFPLDEGPLTVTTSIGIAFHVRGPISPEALLAQADKALYAAKAAGRNGFRMADT